MTISSISSASIATARAVDARSPSAPRATSEARPETKTTALTQAQVPLRFPWMNRVQLLMEQSVQARRIFSEAPVIGGNLDKSA